MPTKKFITIKDRCIDINLIRDFRLQDKNVGTSLVINFDNGDKDEIFFVLRPLAKEAFNQLAAFVKENNL